MKFILIGDIKIFIIYVVILLGCMPILKKKTSRIQSQLFIEDLTTIQKILLGWRNLGAPLKASPPL